jgi:hypothetical protein
LAGSSLERSSVRWDLERFLKLPPSRPVETATADKLPEAFDLRVERLASFQPLNGSLKRLQALILVTLRGEERSVTE